MASPTRGTWGLASSGSGWWTGQPGVLQSMGSQKLDTTEQVNCTDTVSKHVWRIVLVLPINTTVVTFLHLNLCAYTWLISRNWSLGSGCEERYLMTWEGLVGILGPRKKPAFYVSNNHISYRYTACGHRNGVLLGSPTGCNPQLKCVCVFRLVDGISKTILTSQTKLLPNKSRK